MDYSGIKLALSAMQTNVHESSEKIRMAHGLKRDWRALADWQRDMAAAHLQFNAQGAKVVSNCMAAMRSDPSCDEICMGRLDAYAEWMDQINEDTMDVQTMIGGYK